MNYYQRLKDVREDHDKNQTEIAEILQIQQTQYSRYELGKQMMGIDKYIKLAKYYNVSLDYLAGIKDTPDEQIPQRKKNDTKILSAQSNKLTQAYNRAPDNVKKAIKILLNLEKETL